MEKIAVLGGGGTGCCLSAALSLRGFKVYLYEEKKYWHEHIHGINKKGGIELFGNDVTGFTKLSNISDNLADTINGASIIFVSMVAWRHEELAKKIKPLVKPDQTIILSAGNFGSIRFKRIFGMDSPVLVGEMLGNIFPCRMIGEGEGLIASKYSPKKVAAFPAKNNEKLVNVMSIVFGCSASKNVFEVALNSPNLVNHVAGSLLNACAIDRNPDFALYTDGLSESVIACQLGVEKEKEAVIKKLDYLMLYPTDLMKQLIQYDNFPEYYYFRSLKGPNNMKHRYISEDAATGLSMFIDLGDTFGIELPLMQALVKIASVINNTDYFLEGLKLSDLGMDKFTSVDQINEYLYTGINKN